MSPFSDGTLPTDTKKPPFQKKGRFLFAGSPYATLFITVLFLPPLTENLQYQRVIKDQAAPDMPEAALTRISFLCLIFLPPSYLHFDLVTRQVIIFGTSVFGPQVTAGHLRYLGPCCLLAGIDSCQ